MTLAVHGRVKEGTNGGRERHGQCLARPRARGWDDEAPRAASAPPRAAPAARTVGASAPGATSPGCSATRSAALGKSLDFPQPRFPN